MESVLEAITQFFIDLQALGSPSFLFEDPPRPTSPIYIVLLVPAALAFLGGLYMVVRSSHLARGNRLHRALFDRYGTWLAWLGALGLMVIGLRYVSVPLFSKRLWTLLDVLALIALSAHYVRYRIQRYPAESERYHEDVRRRRFIPTPGRAAASATRRPRRRR